VSIASLGLGATFLAVFIVRRNHWWALIPACTFFGLAGWMVLGMHFTLIGTHPVFPIVCVGLSFLVIYLHSFQKQAMRWSLLVGVLVVIASFFYLLGILLARWRMLWPVILLICGCLLPLGVVLLDRKRKGP
jgi:hypothetical protein